MIVIIPTYNEKQNLSLLVKKIKEYLPLTEVLIIDDNSPDGTGELADDLSRECPWIGVIHRPRKPGLGTAYIQGFKFALEHNYEYIFTMDADFSHNPEYLPHFEQQLKKYDFVVGSRYVAGGGVQNWSLHRKLISSVGNFYARTITGISVNDCTSGFIGFRREVIKSLPLDKIHSEGYSFLIEIKFRSICNGFTFTELPIIFADRISGKSKISKKIIFEAMWMVWKLCFEKSSGLKIL